MAEQWTVKQVESGEPKSAQEQETAVLDKAVESGEVAKEFGVERDGIIKVNLDAPADNIVKTTKDETKPEDDSSDQGGVESKSEKSTASSEQEEIPKEAEAQKPVYEVELGKPETGDTPPVVESVEEVTGEETPKVEEPVPSPAPQVELPEDVDKLVAFMKETGGTLEDYVNLNKDFSDYPDEALIKEYYRQQNPRLSEERLERKMKKKFSFDDSDEPDLIQDKKDAFEDELFDAKKYLEGNKEKYYSDLKLRNQNALPPEAQEAVQYFEQYKAQQEQNQQLIQTFQQRTEQVFGKDFKGFEFPIGDKTYRVKVGDSNQVKENQLDLNNFIGKYLGKDGSLENASGYHRDLWAADNIDTIVDHFYQQGRADAIKDKAAQAKGINMDPRQQRTPDDARQSGPRVRAVDSGDSNKLRFKNYRNR